MKIYNTADRLKQYMFEHGINQSDIVRMCEPIAEKYGVKMNRSDISQYVSGKYTPNQKKLSVLAEALGVTPLWLMGIDAELKSGNIDVDNIYEKDFANDLFVAFKKADPRNQEFIMRLLNLD